MFYDMGEKRVAKALKISRKYLTWIQNSVFEGEISLPNYQKLKFELKKIIDKDNDSIIFYTLRTTKYTQKEILGIEKNTDNNII
jgi:CRISPR-associated protein Cas2